MLTITTYFSDMYSIRGFMEKIGKNDFIDIYVLKTLNEI